MGVDVAVVADPDVVARGELTDVHSVFGRGLVSGCRKDGSGGDRVGARNRSPLANECSGSTAGVVGDMVQGAELVVVSPASPVAEVVSISLVFISCGWCAIRERHMDSYLFA